MTARAGASQFLPTPVFQSGLAAGAGVRLDLEHKAASHGGFYFPLSLPGHNSSRSCSASSPAARLGSAGDGRTLRGGLQLHSPKSKVAGLSLEVSDPQEFGGCLKSCLGAGLTKALQCPPVLGGGCLPPRKTFPRPGKQIQTTRGPRGLPSH